VNALDGAIKGFPIRGIASQKTSLNPVIFGNFTAGIIASLATLIPFS
jgi:hypothetical protein